MEVLKALTDHCHTCGASIHRDEGCLFSFRCDACCAAAGHGQTPALSKPAPANVVPPVPRTKKELQSMKGYIIDAIKGLLGKFRRNADGSLECLDLALATDPAGIVRVCTEAEPAAADVRIAAAGHVRLAEGESYLGRDAAGRDHVRRAPWSPTPEQQAFRAYAEAIAAVDTLAAAESTDAQVKASRR